MDKVIALIWAIVGIGLLILIHELGHFLVALKLRFTVKEFSIGFGPKLLGWVGKSGIVYHLRLILFGGFVRIKEIEDDLLQEPESPFARPARAIFRRIAIIGAGPTLNLLAAVLLFFVYSFWMAGMRGTSEIAKVSEGSPAEKLGLRPDDELVGFAHLKKAKLSEIVCYIRSHPNKPVRLRVRRDFNYFTVTVVPNRAPEYLLTRKPHPDAKGFQLWMQKVFGRMEKRERGIIGVTFKLEPIPALPFSKRLANSLLMTLDNIEMAWQLVVAPLTQPILLREVAGPIRITYEVVANRWRGIMEQIHFFGVLSFVIALINLLPLPLLDGGRILFLLIEFFSRRRIYNLELKATYVGLVFLVTLFLFITTKDLHFIFFLRGQ